MTDREKVIKGLECCLNTGNFEECTEKCPYYTKKIGVIVCSECLHRDALSMLKAQEPRVMTLEEVEIAESCMKPVFLEMPDEKGKSGDTPDIFSFRFVKHITTITGGTIFVLENTGFSSALYAEKYNLTWRCWDKRPTDEQRKAVKWE